MSAVGVIDNSAHAASDRENTEQGMIRVQSPEPGAKVYIDSKLIGRAPVTEYLDAGTYTVRVAVDHYDPFVRRIKVTTGSSREITAELTPGGGTVEIQVDPKGARLMMNGKDEWPLPVRLRDLKEGEYEFEITANGFEPATGTFTFKKGRNLLVFPDLRSSEGIVQISSRPADADVLLNGEFVGRTPLILDDVSAGKHVVELDLPGFATVFRRFDTSDGSKGEVEVRMPKKGAKLKVKTGDSDAIILLQGAVIGEGKKVKIKRLERGRYNIEVRAPNRKTLDSQVKVPLTGSAIYKVKLADEATRDTTRLLQLKPFYQRWTFWTIMGISGAGTGIIGTVVYNASLPDPVADGDVLVTFP